MRGFLVGTLALAVLQVLVTGNGPDAAGGLLGYVSTGIEALGDPHRPLLPNRGGGSTKAKPKAAPKAAPTPPRTDGLVPGSPGGPPGILQTTPNDKFLRDHGGLTSFPLPDPARHTYTA